jgi:Peptidase A4 family
MYSSFWVGLGGFARGSRHLEQIGTEADCLPNRRSRAYAWFEIVPAASARLGVAVKPQDRLAAQVTVSGRRVLLRIQNLTTGHSAARTVSMQSPDTSSAEWIAEAPSQCGGGRCQPLPLADFGTVSFSQARASARGRAAAPVNGSGLIPTAITLTGAGPGFGGATPSVLTPAGTGFSVAFRPAQGLPGGPPPPLAGDHLRH